MCCALCFCCNFCNGYSSKCMEIFIFILSFLSFGITIFGFFYINKEHIRLICYIILIILIVFSFLILLSIILILIWRYKEIINTTKNKEGEAFAIIGIVITILSLIFIVSWISMTHSYYQNLNHPCYSIVRDENNIKIEDSESPLTEDIEDFCIENPEYNIHLVPTKEYIIAYIFAATLCILLFLLIYAWFNDYRRIKFLVDGSLNDFDVQVVNRGNNNNENEDSNDKRINERINKKQENQLNNKNLYKIYSQQEYGIRYDIYGRPILTINKAENKNINNAITSTFSKRKRALSNRINKAKDVNVYKKRNSIQIRNNGNEVKPSNSSERHIINKFPISRNKKYNYANDKTGTNSNLIEKKSK